MSRRIATIGAALFGGSVMLFWCVLVRTCPDCGAYRYAYWTNPLMIEYVARHIDFGCFPAERAAIVFDVLLVATAGIQYGLIGFGVHSLGTLFAKRALSH